MGDTSNDETCKDFIEKTVSKFNRIDGLVSHWLKSAFEGALFKARFVISDNTSVPGKCMHASLKYIQKSSDGAILIEYLIREIMTNIYLPFTAIYPCMELLITEILTKIDKLVQKLPKGANPLSYATEIIIEIKQFCSGRMA